MEILDIHDHPPLERLNPEEDEEEAVLNMVVHNILVTDWAVW